VRSAEHGEGSKNGPLSIDSNGGEDTFRGIFLVSRLGLGAAIGRYQFLLRVSECDLFNPDGDSSDTHCRGVSPSRSV
jgi:hypothetical protein